MPTKATPRKRPSAASIRRAKKIVRAPLNLLTSGLLTIEFFGAPVSQRREVFAIGDIDLYDALVVRRGDDVAGGVRHRNHVGAHHRTASRGERAANPRGVLLGYRFFVDDALGDVRRVAQGDVERRQVARHVFGQNRRHVAGVDGRYVDRIRAHIEQREGDDGAGEDGEHDCDRDESRRSHHPSN